ncbi:hypothetical protein [Janibacter terrae]|uniref:hypothetical protein n=1 Tax=Janibacter terrae TaxID=103817 RepID=UPI00082B302D|nr:hypothetical protein [Janibacter terrae]MBA4085213.1 hypothetical protein [Kytococcus sp.]HBO55075.1 hypothetical protein [Janibacter terrae]
MSTLIQRVAGVVLALAGLVAAIVGGWFLANLGTSGTATFTADPGQRVVVLDPDVLNRVDHPVEVTAAGSGELWAGTARPSDAEAVLGDATRAEVSGVAVSDWALTSAEVGSTDPVDPAGLDVWQESGTASGEISRTIEQSQAPQTLVVAAADGAEIDSVTMTVEDSGWGTMAVVTLVVGLVLLLAGVALLVRSGLVGMIRHRAARPDREEAA